MINLPGCKLILTNFHLCRPENKRVQWVFKKLSIYILLVSVDAMNGQNLANQLGFCQHNDLFFKPTSFKGRLWSISQFVAICDYNVPGVFYTRCISKLNKFMFSINIRMDSKDRLVQPTLTANKLNTFQTQQYHSLSIDRPLERCLENISPLKP